jgi:Spy/CpxP family protein refolding chaperone
MPLCKQDTMQTHHKPDHKKGGLVDMFMQLDLDKQQRTKIRTIIKENMKDVMRKNQKMRASCR